MDFTRLDALLDRFAAWRMPGCDCIVIKDGRVLHRYFTGYADIEADRKLTGNETYNMWSCSKPITCAAALTLYEKGLFLLDDPIERYIPEFANPMVKSKDEDGKDILVPAKNKIK
ncbi:MAG: beta-lactamase family protein, partial [Clostridia bacterium]|nr:beta-lactamase family protein [Clostridia bacterium]